MTPRFICESCGKNKNNLKQEQSKLLPKKLLMCQECITRKFEPRYIIILAYMSNIEKAIDFIKEQRYLGEPILMTEVL